MLRRETQGSVSYTVVGNPTIVDGVVSGFSSSNYAKTASSCQANQITEFVVKFNKTLQSKAEIIAIFPDIFLASYDSDAYLVVYKSGGNEAIYPASHNISNNVDCWIKYVNDGTNLYLYHSADGVNYTLDGQKAWAQAMQTTSYASSFGSAMNDIGISALDSGSIDLNNTYIMVNGAAWFGNCPVEVKHHQIKGPVGYTVVGSPTIVDGVASGFSKNNYLNISQSTPAGINSVDIQLSLITSSTTNKQQFPFNWGIFDNNGMAIAFNSANRLVVAFGDGVNAITTYNKGPICAANTKYTINVTIKNGLFKCSCNGVEFFSEETSLLPPSGKTIRLGIHQVYPNLLYLGVIDLNNTYIKVNNELWFYQPQRTKYIKRNVNNQEHLVFADSGLYLSGPVNYTVVGSPTIVDGVASDFSTSNYLTIPGTFNPSTSEWELGTAITANSGTGAMPVQAEDNTYFYFRVDKGGSCYFVYTKSDDTLDFVEICQNYDGNKVFLKSKKVGADITTQYSYDNVTWQNGGSRANADIKNVSYTNFYVGGITYVSGTMLDGTVDMKHTYIKINGDLYFYGKNYASGNIAPVPSGFTYGNTTTDRIGWVDMPTQTYHQAPAGTCLVSGSGSTTYDDYVIEDGKLVAVSPKIYWENLTGGGGGSDFSYIDAGFKPTNKTTFDISYMREQTSESEINSAPFVVTSNTIDGITYNNFGLFNQTAPLFELRYFGNVVSVDNGTAGEKYNLKTELKSDGCYFYRIANDGTIVSTSAPLVADQSAYWNLYIGCWNYGYDNGTSIPFYPMLGRLYYAKFFEDGVLIRHFVPVPSGLVIGNYTVPSNGMFDIVNQQFYANQGTGTFTIGKDE